MRLDYFIATIHLCSGKSELEKEFFGDNASSQFIH